MFLNNIHAVTQNTEPNSILLPDGLLYSEKILSTFSNVYALYPLNETGVTTTALEIVNGYNGTYNGPTLGAIAGPGASMGNAAFYDGLVDYCQLPAASLDGPFDPNLGTLMIWMRVFNAGVWTDGSTRIVAGIGTDASNHIVIYKDASNLLQMLFRRGGIDSNRTVVTTSTAWLNLGITWNGTRIRMYFNGTQQGADLANAGVWAGALTNLFCQIGGRSAFYWHGYPSFLMLSAAEATAAQMATGAIAA